MKQLKLILSAWVTATAIGLLSSCSPRVLTDVAKMYPPSVGPESVVVYEPGDTVPNDVETLGRVSVLDRGTTTNCKYDYVLSLALEETSKVGGNGLAITKHLEPSFWGSSCHQISGLMLRVNDFNVDTSKSNSLQDVIDLDFAIERNERSKRMSPANMFHASVGYGWITSKVYDANGRELSNNSGMEWLLEYEHVWKSGWGIGAMYSGFRYNSGFGSMNLSFLAPELVLRARWDHWIFKAGVGLGVFIYNEPYYTAVGVGSSATLSVEYMVSDHIGIGLSMNSIVGTLPDRSSFSMPNNERTGVDRLNVLTGIRYYF